MVYKITKKNGKKENQCKNIICNRIENIIQYIVVFTGKNSQQNIIGECPEQEMLKNTVPDSH